MDAAGMGTDVSRAARVRRRCSRLESENGTSKIRTRRLWKIDR